MPNSRIRRKLRLASWNCHSLKYKTTDVFDFLKRDAIDVMALQESWLSGAIKSTTLKIRDYKLEFRRDRPTLENDEPLVNHGGICVYVRNGIECVRLNSLESADHEVVWFDIVGGRSKITVCAAYRAPNRSKAEFFDYLENCISSLGPGREVIILGDLNCNVERHTDCVALTTLLSVYGFQQIITEGTHVFNTNQTSIIDVICLNKPAKVLNSGVLAYDPGQLEYHKPVFVEYFLDLPPLKVTKHTKRDFREANIQRFLREMGTVQWEGNSASDCTDYLSARLLTLVDQCFPMVSYVTTEKSLPEITPEIIQAKAEKYRLLQIKRRTRRDEDRIAFNRQCDRLRWMCKNHRTALLEREIASNFGDSRKLWQSLRYYLPISNDKESSQSPLLINNIVKASSAEIASGFNSYFSNVGQTLANQLPDLGVDPLDYVDAPPNRDSFSLRAVTEHDVLSEAKKIGTYKSIAEPLPFRILYRAIVFLLIPLTAIINFSFQEAFVPGALKRAVVTCIYKNGRKDDVANYRPISVLTLAGKIIESLVQKRLSTFINSRQILYSYQSAYRSNHSCEMALNETLAKIYTELDHGREAVVIFLDLKKAFDTIDRTILLRKLDRYGIRGHSLEWFRSLLTDRTQCVKMGCIHSTDLPISVGIPQGSALGPLLFSLYINDVYKACDLPSTLLFADDTALVYTGDISSRTINASLERFYRWMTINKLTLNCTKTKFMLFSKKIKNRADLILEMNGTQIERVSSLKYLGVLIDDDLTFATHIQATTAKLGHLHRILYNNTSFINTSVGEKLITSLALPRLMYGSTVFHRSPEHCLQDLNIIYKKMLRIIYRLPYDTPTAEIYHHTKFLPLVLLRQIQCAQFAFRCLTANCAAYLIDRFRSAAEEGRRRRPDRAAAAAVERLIVPHHRIDVAKQSFLYWCPVILNTIPEDLINNAIDSRHPVKAFTQKYKIYLIDQFGNSNWSRERDVSREPFVA
jgi:exonuclease III